jgi:predicted enzyme related to lactoylglutathione lyase
VYEAWLSVPCVSVGGSGINHGEVTQVVTRDTRWPAGTPCWVDVTVDDVPKAIAFYQALFGWDIELGGPEVGGYSIAHQDGRIAFALWQGGNTSGLQVANEPGSLVWSEHMSRDFDGSKAFYQAVFGHGDQDMSGDGFKYAMLMVDDHEVGGIGEYPEGTPAEMPAAWATYFAVTDTDAAVAKVTELGGRVVRPPDDTPYGRIAVVADNHGAVFSVITPPAS